MDKKIKKILACVDFSDYSLMVMEYAIELAKDSHIIFYNVINRREYSGLETMTYYGPVYPVHILDEAEIQKQKTNRQEQINQLIAEHFPGKKPVMSIKIDVGLPSEQILKAIETEEIDLVIMANKGRGNIERFLFGSAAEKVFRHSPAPVISVRNKKIFKRGSKDESS